jgi:hypothetical protein
VEADEEILQGVRGFLVNFPFDFLKDEVNNPVFYNPEYFVNKAVYI